MFTWSDDQRGEKAGEVRGQALLVVHTLAVNLTNDNSAAWRLVLVAIEKCFNRCVHKRY